MDVCCSLPFRSRCPYPDNALPYTTTTHGMLCYRIKVEGIADCTISALAHVAGSFGNPTYVPTSHQCSSMLSTQWKYIEHWFSILFPAFSTPDGASSEDILKVKTVLQLWIVQFDPHFMQSNSAWIALLNVFKNPIPWTTMLAWVSPTPGYSTDGSNEFVFPPDLSDWLAHVTRTRLPLTPSAGCATMRFAETLTARTRFKAASVPKG